MELEPSAKILIVDDLMPMRTALRSALKRMGYEYVIEAADGTEALAALDVDGDTALVISDWNMEPMDGLALLVAIRADDRFQKLPFMLISAQGDQTLFTKAYAAGASLVLPKPFNVEILRKAITELVVP